MSLCWVCVVTYMYVASMMDKKVEGKARTANRACKVMTEDRQAFWSTFRVSVLVNTCASIIGMLEDRPTTGRRGVWAMSIARTILSRTRLT